MASRSERRREKRGDKGSSNGGSSIRPMLLAAGLGLIWFAEFQDNTAVPTGAPDWAVAAIFGARLFADIVGALVLLSVLRLVLTVTRLAVVRWRLQRQLEVR